MQIIKRVVSKKEDKFKVFLSSKKNSQLSQNQANVQVRLPTLEVPDCFYHVSLISEKMSVIFDSDSKWPIIKRMLSVLQNNKKINLLPGMYVTLMVTFF